MNFTRLSGILLVLGAALVLIGFGNWLGHRPSYARVDASGGGILERASNDWSADAESAYKACLISFSYSSGIMRGSACESSPTTPVAFIGAVLLLAAGGIVRFARA